MRAPSARHVLHGEIIVLDNTDASRSVQPHFSSCRLLKLAGAKVEIVSLRHGGIRGVNLHEPASKARVNKIVSDADPIEYDALLIPGGFINPDLVNAGATWLDQNTVRTGNS